MFNVKEPSQAVKDLIVRSGSPNRVEALHAQLELAKAIEIPLREAILVGDNLIFNAIDMPRGELEYPLDLIAPGEENDLVAYTNPGNGRIPERQVEADYVKLHAYGIANAVDWLLRHANDAEWQLVTRAIEVFQHGFTKKMNDDGWKTLLTAAADRNILVYDADATAGQFTKRLVSLSKIVMRRNGGGNSSSMNRRKLSDIYLSPEGIEDMRNWGLDQVDDTTRREIYLSDDEGISKVFQVRLHAYDEFGVGQDYQNFFTSTLAASLQGSDLELAIGVDITRGTFLMPVREKLQMFNDPVLHRSQKAGVYGWSRLGFACLDNRDVIAMSF